MNKSIMPKSASLITCIYIWIFRTRKTKQEAEPEEKFLN